MMPTPLLSSPLLQNPNDKIAALRLTFQQNLFSVSLENLTSQKQLLNSFDSIRFETEVHAAVDKIQGNHATQTSRDWCRLSPQVGGEKFMVQLYLFPILSRLMSITLKEDVIAPELQRQR